jgi:hypothetical protein
MAKLTNTIIEAAIRGFEAQKQDIDGQIAEMRAMLTGAPAAATDNAAPAKTKRRKLSAAVRVRMKAAQQLRWAKVKEAASALAAKAPAKKAAAKAPAKPAKQKRGLTTAGRKALSIAMKKRWAAKKAAA